MSIYYLYNNQKKKKIINFQKWPVHRILDEWLWILIILWHIVLLFILIDHSIYTAWQIYLWNSSPFSLKTLPWSTVWLLVTFDLISHDFSFIFLQPHGPPCSSFTLSSFFLFKAFTLIPLPGTFFIDSLLVGSLTLLRCLFKWLLFKGGLPDHPIQEKAIHHLVPHTAYFS